MRPQPYRLTVLALAMLLAFACAAPALAGKWSLDVRNKSPFCAHILIINWMLSPLDRWMLEPGESHHFAGDNVGAIEVQLNAYHTPDCHQATLPLDHRYDNISNPGNSELSIHQLKDARGTIIMRHGP